MATGCVKITKKADDFDPVTGKFIPVERRRKNVDLFRGEKLPVPGLSLSHSMHQSKKKTSSGLI